MIDDGGTSRYLSRPVGNRCRTVAIVLAVAVLVVGMALTGGAQEVSLSIETLPLGDFGQPGLVVLPGLSASGTITIPASPDLVPQNTSSAPRRCHPTRGSATVEVHDGQERVALLTPARHRPGAVHDPAATPGRRRATRTVLDVRTYLRFDDSDCRGRASVPEVRLCRADGASRRLVRAAHDRRRVPPPSPPAGAPVGAAHGHRRHDERGAAPRHRPHPPLRRDAGAGGGAHATENGVAPRSPVRAARARLRHRERRRRPRRRDRRSQRRRRATARPAAVEPGGGRSRGVRRALRRGPRGHGRRGRAGRRARDPPTRSAPSSHSVSRPARRRGRVGWRSASTCPRPRSAEWCRASTSACRAGPPRRATAATSRCRCCSTTSWST